MPHSLRVDPWGFRLRGHENTRIEAFTDAAFAFAVTLLMIGGGHVPTNVAELTGALRDLPGYAASFALLCLFWYAHYIWYRRYGIEDGRSVALSLLLIFLVLIYVYPLHIMFSYAFMIFGSRPLNGALALNSWADAQTMFMVFGIAYASMSGVIMLFYLHALNLRDELELDAREIEITHTGLLRWLVSFLVGSASTALALAVSPQSPKFAFGLPGLLYWLLMISGPLLRRRLRRRLARLGSPA